MINVIIDSIRKPEDESILVVILKETDKERYLVVPVSKNQGEFLILSLEKTERTKEAPLQMYEFVSELLDHGRLKINRVIISDTKNGYYLAKIAVAAPSIFSGKQKVLDCYASDALIIAIRINAPIFVTEALMEEKGMSAKDNSLTQTVES